MDRDERLRIIVVDDSALYRQMISNVLRDIESVEVIAVAKNGPEALDKMAELKPDVITLDYEMPGLNGIQVLKRMKRRGVQAKAIMVSSYTAEGAKVTTDALLEGAFDFIRKPTASAPDLTRSELQVALLEKLASIRESITDTAALPEGHSANKQGTKRCDAVVIGASTGGPRALRQVLSRIPGTLSLPLIVVQHMPMNFTGALARRLNEACELEVIETSDATRIRPGAVYIAAGGKHTKLVRRNQVVSTRLTDDPRENSCRPAVDYTLRSVADVYDGHVCSIILTGMGRDGLRSCQLVRDRGGTVIAQHPSDCVVYGMPKAIITANLADQVLRLSEIPDAIVRLANRTE